MMPGSSEIAPVLAAYPAIGRPTEVQALGNSGGFSGARFWQIITTRGLFCLRCWPAEYPREGELDFMHRVLFHASAQGFDVAAVPLQNSAGATFINHSGRLWELDPWMPGSPDDSERPAVTRITAAMTCLARFHRSCEEFTWDSPFPHKTGCPTVGVSPGVHKRVAMLQEWLSVRATQLECVLSEQSLWSEMRRRIERLLRSLPNRLSLVAGDLLPFLSHSVSLQPCIRDVWHDHVLFQADQVTGLIDFGSMGIDHVSCDVARLLGSLARQNDPQRWQLGLETYASIRPLSDLEQRLIDVFHRSGVLLGALNWAAWVCLDRRVFENPQAVLRRLDALLAQMETDLPLPPTERGLIL